MRLNRHLDRLVVETADDDEVPAHIACLIRLTTNDNDVQRRQAIGGEGRGNALTLTVNAQDLEWLTAKDRHFLFDHAPRLQTVDVDAGRRGRQRRLDVAEDVEGQYLAGGVVGLEQDFLFELARLGVGLERGENTVARCGRPPRPFRSSARSSNGALMFLTISISRQFCAAGILARR